MVKSAGFCRTGEVEGVGTMGPVFVARLLRMHGWLISSTAWPSDNCPDYPSIQLPFASEPTSNRSPHRQWERFTTHPQQPTYCKPSTWTFPEPNSTNLTVFLEQTQNLIPNPPPRATRSNLTSQKRSTLKKLGSNQDLVSNHSTRGVGYASWTQQK